MFSRPGRTALDLALAAKAESMEVEEGSSGRGSLPEASEHASVALYPPPAAAAPAAAKRASLARLKRADSASVHRSGAATPGTVKIAVMLKRNLKRLW